jgi:hypothetical protein
LAQNEFPLLVLVIIEGTRITCLHVCPIFEASLPLDGIFPDKHIYSDTLFMCFIAASPGHSNVHSKTMSLSTDSCSEKEKKKEKEKEKTQSQNYI